MKYGECDVSPSLLSSSIRSYDSTRVLQLLSLELSIFPDYVICPDKDNVAMSSKNDKENIKPGRPFRFITAVMTPKVPDKTSEYIQTFT